jgi:hypothetical protein
VTVDEIKRFDFIPSVLKEKLEFYGFLGANSPAIAAARTARHIVGKNTACLSIHGAQGVRRAVLNACQAPVTAVIDLKIGHAIHLLVPVSFVADCLAWAYGSMLASLKVSAMGSQN